MQVINRRNTGLELFKLSDKERIKEFEILFDVSEDIASQYNKIFNEYFSTYFSNIKFRKFYNGEKVDINVALTIISVLDKNHQFYVNKFPLENTLLVNFNSNVNLRIYDNNGRYTETIGNGEYYLMGANIKFWKSEVFIPYSSKFVDNYMEYIKNPSKPLNLKFEKYVRIIPEKQDPIPFIIDYERIIPKSMIRQKTVITISLSEPKKIEQAGTTIETESIEYSDEIQKNEISQILSDDIFEKISILDESGVFENFEDMDKYQLTSHVCEISDSLTDVGLSQETTRHLSLIAHVIYLTIHDNKLKINKDNTIVKNYTAGDAKVSLLDYFIKFMCKLSEILFKLNYKKYIPMIKAIYQTFVTMTRKKLKYTNAPNILIIPTNSCGYYNASIDGKNKFGTAQLKSVFEVFEQSLRDESNVKKIEYAINDITILPYRYSVMSEKLNIFNYRFVVPIKEIDGALKETAGKSLESIEIKNIFVPFNVDYNKVVSELSNKINNKILNLEFFGFMKNKYGRRKHHEKDVNIADYYKLATKMLKTTITELIYEKVSHFRPRFQTIFGYMNSLSITTDYNVNSNNLRGLLFKLLLELPANEILTFLEQQQIFYDKFEIIDYDIEYKKQKKIEQFEKRNYIYYNMRPEEKLLLGIDKLYGEERSQLLDRLVAEKFPE